MTHALLPTYLALDLNRCGWNEWTIPAADIQLQDVVSSNSRGELVCKYVGVVWSLVQ